MGFKRNEHRSILKIRCMQKFESNGTFVTKWGSKGTTDGTMQKPEDLALNSITGDVYVTDTKNSRIQKFSEVR